MKKIEALIYKLGYPIAKIYWFIFRPKSQGVQCLILYRDEILLIKNTYRNTLWELPGGGCNKSEDKFSAVKREIKEELSLIIEPQYLGEYTQNNEYRIDTVHCFVAHLSQKKEIKFDESEIKDVQWWDLKELPTPLSKRVNKILEMYSAI